MSYVNMYTTGYIALYLHMQVIVWVNAIVYILITTVFTYNNKHNK